MEPEQTNAPQWLTAEERRAWLALGGVVLRLPTALDGQLRRDAGLRFFEYMVLAGLSEAPDRTRRMSELAAFAEGSLSRLSQVVAKLEHRGLVVRSPDPEDRRATLATLTDAGWDLVVRTAPGHVEAVRTYVFDALTDAQVPQLTAVAEQILQRTDPQHERPADR
ncbi:MarR family winged helix-turn-helix transcriptional regulator [Raineyella sp. LH-20]|uniref:MarR family winged helix-turn-helix transcriptional regulator n=1 Tax=Raineyella sp. LH-20 TaxID=3081204 RepID=UPI002952B3EA|nr:MarR family transcriptional regulator [Raineyella sp. LH-20]WOP19778.1 MarR family transcriptional regulator [Raineyella sp. LH-20]